MSIITVELQHQPALGRRPCVVCGGATSKSDVVAEAPDVGFVCADCLDRGPEAASETLERHAEELEHRAGELRRLAEASWEMPTLAQLREEELVGDALDEVEEATRSTGSPHHGLFPTTTDDFDPRSPVVAALGELGVHFPPACCSCCGQSALKAFSPEDAPRFGASYVCAHCVEAAACPFGGCPQCGGHDGVFNAGRGHWFVCHEHRTRWFVGTNLFSSWKHETEDQQRHAYDVEPGWGAYEEVDERHPEAS